MSRPKYLKTIADFEIINQILDENRELNKYRELNGKKKEDDGFMQFMMTELKQARCYPLDEIYQKRGLNGYLESIVGNIMLTAKDRSELIEKVDIKQNGKLLKSDENRYVRAEEMLKPVAHTNFQGEYYPAYDMSKVW